MNSGAASSPCCSLGIVAHTHLVRGWCVRQIPRRSRGILHTQPKSSIAERPLLAPLSHPSSCEGCERRAVQRGRVLSACRLSINNPPTALVGFPSESPNVARECACETTGAHSAPNTFPLKVRFATISLRKTRSPNAKSHRHARSPSDRQLPRRRGQALQRTGRSFLPQQSSGSRNG